MTELVCLDVGRSPYLGTLALQRRLVRLVQTASEQRAYLILAEHSPPVITLGISADRQNILAPPNALARAGIEVHRTRRGGNVTYHGPGQLVGYPILRVDLHGKSLRLYLRQLEEVLIRALARLAVAARRRDGLTGVWLDAGKVAAIGVAVRRWVSYHGFALNVSPEMRHFGLIVPCGLRGEPVTSLAETLHKTIPMERVKGAVIDATVEVFGFAGWRPGTDNFPADETTAETGVIEHGSGHGEPC